LNTYLPWDSLYLCTGWWAIDQNGSYAVTDDIAVFATFAHGVFFPIYADWFFRSDLSFLNFKFRNKFTNVTHGLPPLCPQFMQTGK
jgi:hypothetical protein